MTRSDTPVHIRRLARLSPRWRVTLTALFLLASSGASAFAQNYTFDARRVALGGAGGTPNVASKLVERQRRYKSIMIPVGLLKVLSNVRVFFPTHEDFDFSRAVEFGYSPLHHVFGRGEDLRPSRFFKDLRNATLERAELGQDFHAAYLMIVADGMGGHAAGEVASRMAITTLINILLHVPDWIMRLDDEHAQKVMDRAVARCRQVHEALQDQARFDERLRGMGTTMTAAFSLGEDLFITQVGDSRAYLFRDGALQRLTHDQTHAQMLADSGIISQRDVARHRLRHVLTSALGGPEKDVHVAIERMKLVDGDRLLLCSDGLSDLIDDDAISHILARESRSEPACHLLVDAALANGGRDNVTVVVARYAIPED